LNKWSNEGGRWGVQTEMSSKERVNILMVDDQPGKLLTYEAILGELDENLIKATSARAALEKLLKIEVAVVLLDVSMPEIDGFELAEMIRQHPRFQSTAILFISAVHLTDLDRLKGYQRGAVDYISVPVNPELLRAKVSIFAELHRKASQLEKLNRELEQRVMERTLELRESEAQFRTLANSIPQLSWMAAPDGSMVWYNDRWYEYTGVPREDADGLSWQTRLDPDERKRIVEKWHRLIAKGEPFEMEFRLRGVDGVYRWFLTQVIPVRDSNGTLQRWFGTRTNIHEQREIRHALEETQERLMMAQKAATCGTFDWDVKLDVNKWSEDLTEMYGFPRGAFPETHDAWLECILPEDREAALFPLDGHLDSATFESQYRIRRRDNGEIRWINARGRITRDTDGDVARIVGLNIDITRMKRAEEELQRAHDELDLRVTARTAELRIAEENLRNLSGRLMRSQDEERRRIARELHDGLGQYLVAVKMSLDVLGMTPADDAKLAECIEDATKQIERAISETRTMSHLLHPPLLDEIGLESAIVWYAEGFAKRSGIAVDVSIAPSLGRLETEAETTLFRVVQECLTNIHRHSDSSTAKVQLSREQGEIRLEVRDEGKGMFATQGDKNSQMATPGIGLQGIRERARQLQGTVDIVSNNGKGTAVILTIPDPYRSSPSPDNPSESLGMLAAQARPQ
jgi:PAS domain S-box-containing protein